MFDPHVTCVFPRELFNYDDTKMDLPVHYYHAGLNQVQLSHGMDTSYLPCNFRSKLHITHASMLAHTSYVYTRNNSLTVYDFITVAA